MNSMVLNDSSVQSWTDLLDLRAKTSKDEMAYTLLSGKNLDHAEAISYSQLRSDARALGAVISENGVHGKPVVIILSSGLDYIRAFFATLYAGCVPVTAYPANTLANIKRIESIIKDCSPGAVITSAEEIDRVKTIEQSQGDALKYIDVKARLNYKVELKQQHLKSDDIAFLQYTSGSTSTPKGVMVTHRNLFHNCEVVKVGLNYQKNSIIGSWLPLHHDMGLIGNILSSLYGKVPCYFMSPRTFLRRPELWLEMISRYRCTISGAPNFAFDMCVTRANGSDFKDLDLSSWIVGWTGSENVRSHTVLSFQEKFAQYGFKNNVIHPCYGLAEATLMVTAKECGVEPLIIDKAEVLSKANESIDASAASSVKYVTAGRVLPGMDLAIVDLEDFTALKEKEVGEVWISSVSIAKGYWERPEETQATFKGKIKGSDKHYLRTGDLGFLYKGQLFINGRIKDIFISNGKNIYPSDIEATITKEFKEVRDSGVVAFGIEVECNEVEPYVMCEVIKAHEKTINYEVTARKIASQVQNINEIGLSRVIFVKSGRVPLTTSGKVQRQAAKNKYKAGDISIIKEVAVSSVAPTSLASDSAGHEVDRKSFIELLCHFIEGKRGVSLGQIDQKLLISDLGLSSIEIHEFIAHAEQQGYPDITFEDIVQNNPSLETLSKRYDKTPEALGSNLESKLASETTTVKKIVPGIKTHKKYEQKVHNESHGYIKNINPEFGRRLSQFKLDKEFVKGKGSYLYDDIGTPYLDFISQYGALPFGHNPEYIWDALMQCRELGHPSLVQPSFQKLASDLAEKLAELAPGDLSYVTFCNSGTEAVEAALKMAASSTGRRKTLALKGAFHGKTLGSLGATGREKYRKGFALANDDFTHIETDDINQLERCIESGEYAAFIVEVIQGEAGVVETSPSFLRSAQDICRKYGTLFIVDEVQTGLGRVGHLFYSDHIGLQPDIITLAKALGGGLMPIGACLTSKYVYNDEFGLRHTSTFAGNALAMAAGLATLEKLTDNQSAILKHVQKTGVKLKQALIKLQNKYPQLISSVRGSGLMLGVKFEINRYNFGDGLLASVSEEEFITSLLMSYMLNKNHVRTAFSLNDGQVLRVQPSLNVTDEECDIFLKALDQTLHVLSQQNMASMVEHLLNSGAKNRSVAALSTNNHIAVNHAASESSFGFLLHPLTNKTYTDFDPTLAAYNSADLETLGHIFGDNFDPFLGGENQILSNDGSFTTGEFWVVPRTASCLTRMPPNQALLEVQAAFNQAVRGDAKVVGLGAFTSVVTQGGLLLSNPNDVAITSGNCYTALVGFQSVMQALNKTQRTLSDVNVVVVGATGSIGRMLSILLAPFVDKLALVGNPQNHESSLDRLSGICNEAIANISKIAGKFESPRGSIGEMVERSSNVGMPVDKMTSELLDNKFLAIGTNVNDYLSEADVIITATSSTEALIDLDQLKGSIICDISRPSNVAQQMSHGSDKDIMIYDGGIVRLPNGMSLGMRTELDAGLSYACMAETMLIALENRPELASIGSDIDIDNLFVFQSLARKHGFEVHIPEVPNASNIDPCRKGGMAS